MRSLLFVPADSDRKLAKAADTPADALILDLEDAVSAQRKSVARAAAAQYLAAQRGARPLWVRINGLDTAEALDDLTMIVPAAPAGLLLPKVRCAADVTRLGHHLDALEAAAGLPAGEIGIIPLATETPQAIFNLASYAQSSRRLRALTWGAEDLGAAVGALAVRDPQGQWLGLFAQVQSMLRIAAAAAAVPAIETIYADFRNLEGLRSSAVRARQIGFSGMLAIHPGQVPVINEVFSYTAQDIAHARRVIAAFADAGEAGVVSVDGSMLDKPHLDRARALLRTLGE